MKHVASCSFGKDSLASVLLALEHGEPLDEVVYCEVMFDKEVSGEIPEHIAFIRETAIPYLKSAGIKVTHLQSEWTYLDHFFFVITKGQRKGLIRGFPLCGNCSICRDCKLPPIREYERTIPENSVYYVGIAKDEQDRLLRLKTNKISLLEKYEYTELKARELCKRHGLLSPIYEFADRNGCFFCPNAKERELRHLYDYHRDLWDRLLLLQKSPNMASKLFNRTQRFDAIDRDFRTMDNQGTIFDFMKGENND